MQAIGLNLHKLIFGFFRVQKFRARYSGHLFSRLAGDGPQHDQTTWFSYYMRESENGQTDWICISVF